MNRIEAYTPGGRIEWDNVQNFWMDPGNVITFIDESGNYIGLVNMPIVYTAIKSNEEDSND